MPLQDMKLARNLRGKMCVDGSVPDFFAGNCDLLTKQVGRQGMLVVILDSCGGWLLLRVCETEAVLV